MQPFQFSRTADAKSAVLMHGSGRKDASSDTGKRISSIFGWWHYIARPDETGSHAARAAYRYQRSRAHQGPAPLNLQRTACDLARCRACRLRPSTPISGETSRSCRNRCNLQQARRFETWPRSAAMSCQRTRCSYFRDVSYENCNKRRPGSGCAALEWVLTARMPFWEPAINVSQLIQAILPKP